MLSAASTEARELELFVENRIGGDSNVFRRQSENNGSINEVRGGVWELAPRVTLRDEQDELQYSFSYQPTYERFFALEDGENGGNISGFDHNANADLEWLPDAASRINLEGTFFRQRRLRQEFVNVGPAADPIADASDNEYLQRGRGTLSFYRQLSGRFAVRGSVSYDNFDAERSDQSDTVAYSGSAGFDYSILQHTRLGVTGSFRSRDSVATIDGNALPAIVELTEFRSNTQTIDISFSIQQQVTEHLEVVVAAGPSFFQTRDEQSRLRMPGGAAPTYLSFSDDQSVFALVQITYNWRRGRLDASYRRSEGGAGGGTAAATIVDSVAVGITHQPAREWTLRANFNWNNRESLSSTSFFGLDTRLIGLSGAIAVERRIARRFEVIGRFSYGWTNRDQFRGVFNPINVAPVTVIVTGTIAIRYTFDPYVF